MIIVSQDKNVILNFDNTTTIKAEKQGENYRIVARMNNGHFATLGEYLTEERVKEVMSEIINCYAHTEQYKCFSNNSSENRDILNELAKNSFIYGMPKESDNK